MRCTDCDKVMSQEDGYCHGCFGKKLDDVFDEEMAVGAAEELGLTPDEAERAVEDYRDL